MSLETITPERVGITVFIILYVSEKVVLPLATKFFPQLFKRGDREQAREDTKLKFDHEMKLREIEAWEMTAKAQIEIGKVLGVMNDRIGIIEDEVLKKPRKVKQ